MKNPQLLDLYSDYLISSFTLTTAVGLSELLDNGYSHDQISRFLAQKKLLPRDFWKQIKKLVRAIESDQGVIAIDDSIEEKPHTTENDIVCWHWDHCKNRNIKGINLLNFLYVAQSDSGEDINLPIAYEIIEKTESYYDEKSDKVKRRSSVSKNELVRERLSVLTFHNKVKYGYLSWDTWFSSKENFEFVHKKLKKFFVAALKENRTVALSYQDKREGKFKKVSEQGFQANRSYEVWIKGLDFPVKLIKQVFTNIDGSSGEAYLVTNDLKLTHHQTCTIYKKRWNVEVFHKSLKQNAALEKSPTKNETTQSNHVFASMIAFCKLEVLKFAHATNHFGLKSRLYIRAVKAAFNELQFLKTELEQKLELKQETLALM